ncbi:MAG: hypothetical protein EPN91_08470 [Salinibacterium sp.]|nr:MAG: hypothetical protein EPN91_08470 [Salinibacterium sp.]
MARGKRSRRRNSGGGARAFCPVIRVKCPKRKYSQATGPSFVERAGKYAAYSAQVKAAKSKLKKAMGFGSVHPQAEATSLPAAAVQTVAKAKANLVGRCTVSMGGRSYKVSGAAVGNKIAELIRAQRSGGCCSPKVQRG